MIRKMVQLYAAVPFFIGVWDVHIGGFCSRVIADATILGSVLKIAV